MLDRNIFQVFITDDNRNTASFGELDISSRSLKDLYPDYKYHLLNGEDLESFVGANFDADTLQCLRTLKPYSYKANLGRYCLLLKYGGVYADVVIRLLRRIEIPDGKKIVCFRDSPGTGLWTVSTSLIAAECCRGEFKLAIDLIKENVAIRHYGANPLHVSGPAVFGRALAITNRIEEIEFGSFDFLGNNYNPYNLGHIDSAGRIVSLRWKSGQFTDLGVKGTNNYGEMWLKRTVYGESTRFFKPSDLSILPIEHGGDVHISRDERGIIFLEETHGWISYGPYIDIDAGMYRAIYQMSSDSIL